MPDYPAPGVGGSVAKAADTIGNITQWSGGPDIAVTDTTPFLADQSYQQNTPTIKKWAFKFSGSTDISDAAQAAMHAGIGEIDTYKFYIDDTHFWSGTAILNKISDKADAQKGVVTSEYDLTGTAPLTWT